jgi:polysaccharide biosynthesis protein PslG
MSVGPRLILGLALALCLALAAPAGARRDVPQRFYGTVLDGDVLLAPPGVQAAQWAQMARSGVETTRVVFSWSDAQPVPTAPPDFRGIDQVVANAVSHGIELLPVVIYAPPWARQNASEFNSPPADPAQYAAFLTALIGRYGPQGSFWNEHPELARAPLRTWQIWNEPQLRYQWNAPDYADGYGKLLRVAYPAVKAADPGARVVLAGATNLSWEAIDSLYKQGGIHGFFDVVAVHPYTATPVHVERIVQLVRQVLGRHGDNRLPVWVTELGFPASKGKSKSKNTLQTTARGAAKRLVRTYNLLARDRHKRSVRVDRVYWYTWSSSYTGDIFNFTGLYRFDGTSFRPQPQLVAYRSSARRHEGCKKAATGRCR